MELKHKEKGIIFDQVNPKTMTKIKKNISRKFEKPTNQISSRSDVAMINVE